MIPVITIEGPTASGKTTFAIQLAQYFDTEIISADSRQVYQYLDIGTAKPSLAELSLVKHHLIGIIEPSERFNAGLFQKQAMAIIHKLNIQSRIPIICGGTGLYIKALLEGLFKGDSADAEVRKQLETDIVDKGLGALYLELQKVDIVAAEKLNCNDKQRILRALEVYRSTGIPISAHWLAQETKRELIPFRILLDEDRAILYNRIDKRVNEMIERGLVAEINNVLTSGYCWSDTGLNSVGYKEFKPYFENKLSTQDCISLAQQHTRNYAKRQFTWYKKCTFNLAGRQSSVSISDIAKKIKVFLDKNS
jgi:tRNA dimethylallyltransferase